MLNMLARNLRSAAFVAAPAITILSVHASRRHTLSAQGMPLATQRPNQALLPAPYHE